MYILSTVSNYYTLKGVGEFSACTKPAPIRKKYILKTKRTTCVAGALSDVFELTIIRLPLRIPAVNRRTLDIHRSQDVCVASMPAIDIYRGYTDGNASSSFPTLRVGPLYCFFLS